MGVGGWALVSTGEMSVRGCIVGPFKRFEVWGCGGGDGERGDSLEWEYSCYCEGIYAGIVELSVDGRRFVDVRSDGFEAGCIGEGGSKVRRVGEDGIVDGINWIGVDAP